jgi:large subunit ribosomal protein L21e
MVKKSRGFRSGTRKKLRKKKRRRTSVTKFLQKFKKGDKVMIVQDPSSQKGMPFPRFKGKTAKIAAARGKSYILELKDGKKSKFVISKPEHLKKIGK